MQPTTALDIARGDRAPRYAIAVTEHIDGYELRVPELLLAVTATSLKEGYERLLKREREIVELARNLGALHELPTPAAPATLRPVLSELATEINPDVMPL